MSNACPACGKKYSLPTGSVGRAFVCKRCGLKLQISDRGLTIPSVPESGPPIPPPQPVNHGPPPAVEYEPVAPPRPAAPVAAQPVPAAYPPPGYYPYPPTPPYPSATQPRDEFDVTPADDYDLPRRRPPDGNVLFDFLLLRRHIAPTLIVLFFWVGTVLLVGSGLLTVAGSFDVYKEPVLPDGKIEKGFSVVLFLTGLGQIVFGPIALRVACEFVIVVFRINETLLDVKDRLGRDRT